MQAPDFERFKSIMAGMGRMFGADMDGVLLDAYWLALYDWSVSDFEMAAAHLIADSTFMPKPVDFTRLRQKASDQTAGDAWALVLQAVRTMRARENPTVAPKIDAVVRQMGGYQHLGCMTTEEMPWRMKRFTELWAEQGEVEQAQIALPSAGKKLTGPQRASLAIVRQ